MNRMLTAADHSAPLFMSAYKTMCISDVKPVGDIENRRQAEAKEEEETW